MGSCGHWKGSWRWSGGYGPAVALVNVLLILWGSAAAAADKPALSILALGDSLSAGYNLPHDAAFPVQLEEALRDKGYDVSVINAGVSGDTTAGGLSRLDWTLGDDVPDVTILELGANDALRGLPPAQVKANLAALIEGLQARGSRVLLAGMLAPPNMGADYAEAFNAIYPTLADRYDTALYPFFLDGVAGQTALLQSDAMHPTADGVGEIVRRILPKVEKLLNEELAGGQGGNR